MTPTRSPSCCRNNLPAIPAAAATTTAATALAATAATSSAAALASRHGTSFVHYHGAAHQVAAVARLDGASGRGGIVDVHKTESACFAGKTVSHYIDCVDRYTRLRKERFDIRLAGTIWQVAHKKSHELNLLMKIRKRQGNDRGPAQKPLTRPGG